jgi:hypothetical protein
MSGSTPPWFIQQFFDASGKPLSGGKVYFWVAGSTVIPKAVYSDIALTTPISQPVVLDAGGFALQYFVESGLYKIQTFTAAGGAQQTCDNVQGAASGGGGSTTQFLDSTTIHWSVVNIGGVDYEVGTVQSDQVGDHKVLTDATAGDVPGYLVAKFVDAAGNPLLVNGAHQLVLPFAQLDGAAFTGAVSVAGQFSSVGDTALATGAGATVHLIGPATIEQAIANILKLPGITPGQWLMLNGSGQVVGVAAPSSDHKVLYDVSDAIPGLLGVKIQAGSGININVTTDGTNGKVMHVNVQPGYFARTIYKSILASAGLSGSTPITLLQGVVPAIPKNTLAVGDVIRIKVMNSVNSGGGIIGIAVNSNGIQLYGGTGFSSGFNGFNMEYTITILSLGPSGSVDVNGAGYSTSGQFSLGNYSNTIDTTVDNILDVKANTDTTVTLTNTVCTIERL